MTETTDSRHLAALRTHWRRHKAFPAMAKLAGTLGLSSSGSVFAVVGRLTDAGFLERVEGRIAPTRKFFSYPLVGHVRAGLPQPASQDSFEVLNIEDVLVRDPNRTSFCHVRGDSMKDAGLLDGDVVVLEANRLPANGDIVVAVVDGQTTVKYLRSCADGGWLLEPANPAYQPIKPTDSLEVLGVVVGSFRSYRR
jgi:repressor LexA